GHRLVADDVVELEKGAQGLVGRSPKIVRHYMELRGLGVINVKDLFGANAIQLSMPLELVVRLERWDKATEVERLGLEERTYTVLGVNLPLVTMPVGPGRNLAMLIEVAVRNHLMSVSGRNPARLLARSISTAARRRSKGGR
ncbi:MAG: HPr kinase/phosphorylase, partial [Vicinamibacteria bacterium]